MVPEFPPPPPHFYRFAWRGMPLILPDSWHLRLHEGSDRRGALVFSDLRQTQLELRWQTPANIFPRQKNAAQRLLEKTLTRLLQKRPAAAVARLAPNAVQFQLAGKSVALIATTLYSPRLAGGNASHAATPNAKDHAQNNVPIPPPALAAACGVAAPPRLYELSCPLTSESPHAVRIIQDLLESLPRAAEHPAQFWSVYGAQGWIPPRFRLRKLSLLPGSVTLTFIRRGFLGAAAGNSITLGSISLADRLLAQHRSLQSWAAAAFPLLQRLPAGTWNESPTTLTFTAPDRRLLRTRRHTLELHHDPPANQIRWVHRMGGPGQSHLLQNGRLSEPRP